MAWKTSYSRFDYQPGRSNCLYRRLLDLGGDASTRIIFGFSNGWSSAGATGGKEMRNAMLVASTSFAATILLIPFDLMALVGSVVGYLALRGMNLWYLISYVYKMVNP